MAAVYGQSTDRRTAWAQQHLPTYHLGLECLMVRVSQAHGSGRLIV